MPQNDLSFETKRLLFNQEVIFFYPLEQGLDYLQNLLCILNTELCKPKKIHIVVFDGATKFSRTKFWRYGEKRLRLEAVREVIARFNIIYGQSVTYEELSSDSALMQPKKLKSLIDLKEFFSFDLAIYHSIRSILASRHTRSSLKDFKIKRLKRLVGNYIVDYGVAMGVAKIVASRFPINHGVFIFLNGRAPNQAGIRSVLEKREHRFLAFDWGGPTGTRMLLEDFQGQQSRELQDYWLAIREQYEPHDVERAIKFAKEWLISQSTSVKVNNFLTISTIEVSRKMPSNGKRFATIFSSSVDEEAYNLEEDTNGWVNQTHAIVASSRFLSENGLKVVVRIHPNAANRCWIDLGLLVKALIDANIDFYLPWDQTSSYQLIRESDFVGTWISRIGLESACMGKPTFYLGDSPFSRAAQIKTVSPADLHSILAITENPTELEKKLLTIYQIYHCGLDIAQFNDLDFHLQTMPFRNVAIRQMSIIERIFYIMGRLIKKFDSLHAPTFGDFGVPNNLIRFIPMKYRSTAGAKVQSLYLRVYILLRLS